MKARRPRQVLVAVGLSALSCTAVTAADLNTPSAQVDTRPGFSPPQRPDLFKLPPVEPTEAASAPASDEAVALHLRQAMFHGNTVVSTDDLQALVAPHINHDLSAADLEAMRIGLTRLYVDRGYVNSGLRIKRVDAAAGVIEFDVIEGRLVAVQLTGMERLDDDYVLARLRRPDDGPLNLDQLRERFQLLLDDPLFERMNARLIPGQAPGEAVLAVDVKRARPYEIRLFANNYRPVSIGAASVGVSGLVRNLTGRGDLLEASLQAPAEGGGDLRGGL
ncbi:MAG: POTRA domain-containing protein, partial [Ideonella sp.]